MTKRFDLIQLKVKMDSETRRNRILHRAYAIGIWIKGFDATLEILGGFIYLLAGNLALNQLVIVLTQHELIEDPHDMIATALSQAVAQLPFDAHLFAGTYLIIHGITKVFLIIGLWRSKPWAFRATIGFLCLFITYQLYRLSYNLSPLLMLLTIFDFIFVLLIWRESRLFKN